MLLLTLLIHWLLWYPGLRLAEFTPLLSSLPWPFQLAVSLVASAALARLFALLVDTYAPATKPWWRGLLRLAGVRWMAALAASGTAALLLAESLRGEALPSVASLGFLLPLIGISGLHALGVEIPLRRLDDEPVPGKVILPPRLAPPAPKEEIVRTFRWEHRGVERSFNLVLRRGTYDELRAMPRVLDPPRWAEIYVAEGITGEVREVALQLLRCGLPFGTYEEVELVLGFVQQVVAYEADEGEYPKYPVETLAERKGDCEDYAILAAAILKVMGYECALLIIPGHAALGVAGAESVPGVYAEKDGLRYFYCEMTGGEWKMGVLPGTYTSGDLKAVAVPDPRRLH